MLKIRQVVFLVILALCLIPTSLMVNAIQPSSINESNPSDPVEQVISQINALPSVITLANEETVQSIRQLYNALNETQKAEVTNYQVLVDAEEAITLAFAKVVTMEVIIEAINCPVSLIDKADVISAREIYEQLDEAQKARVQNYVSLLDAEREIARLEQAAFDVIDLIDALPATVTLAYKNQVVAARLGYNRLNNRQKAYITNLDKLLEAELKIIDCEIALVVIEAIDELPETISLADIDDVQDAKNGLDALTPPQLAKVDQWLVDKLNEALIVANKLDAVRNLQTRIRLLPETITADEKEEVFELQSHFDSFDDVQKAALSETDQATLQAAYEQALLLNQQGTATMWIIISASTVSVAGIAFFLLRKKIFRP